MMKYHVRYKPDNLILFTGCFKACHKLFRQYRQWSYYEIVSDQVLKEEAWEF